ncbi:MAG: hypothetical protein HJJLKODD_02732 [Phycisphaerae bacterium]|nr:hypothetical protein [Phycisphaerae bacterium]
MSKSRLLSVLCPLFVVLVAGPAFGETPEELLKRVTEKNKAMTSATYKTHSITKSMGFESEDKSTVWMTISGETMKMRSEGESQQKMAGTEQQSKTLVVSDGEILWSQVETGGQTNVSKMKANKTSPFDYSPILNMGKATVKDAEDVNGEKCDVLEIVMDQGGQKATTLMYFSQKSGMMLKSVTTGEQMESTTLITDVQINVSIPDDKFSYTAPAGVEVMDMTNMPGMGGTEEAPSEGTPKEGTPTEGGDKEGAPKE